MKIENLKFRIVGVLAILVAGLFNAVPAFAHAVIKPSTAGVGSFTDFSLGVPSEKDSATIMVELMIPAGVQNISPIVKPGWKIDVKQSPDPTGAKDDDGNPAMIVTEIDWTGGQVPAHQKDFFMFSAQVPAQEGELDWKVEQTYADGSVVSWTKTAADQPKDEKGNPDFSRFGPYSKTMVINDLKASPSPGESTETIVQSSNSSNITLILSGLAVLTSIVSLGISFRRR